ncbi:MAG: hypothetical protein R3A79_00830 [Nannocystaceae bacterium]
MGLRADTLRRGARALAGLVAAATLSGCAYASERVIRRSTPAAIEETLGALNDPDNQEAIRALVGDADVQDAIRELAEAMTSGALDGLSDEARAERLQAISEQMVTRLIAAAGEGIRDEITPSVERLVERTVSTAIERSLGPATRRDAEALARGVVREAAATMVASAATGLREDLGPALASVIEEDIEPALERALAERLIPALAKAMDEELRPLLKAMIAELTREAAKQVVLGVDDALVELEIVDPVERRELIRSITGSVGRGARIAELLAWLLAAVAIILTVFLVRALLRARSLRERTERMERTFDVLVRRVRESGRDEPWIRELVEVAEATVRDTQTEVAAADPAKTRTDR